MEFNERFDGILWISVYRSWGTLYGTFFVVVTDERAAFEWYHARESVDTGRSSHGEGSEYLVRFVCWLGKSDRNFYHSIYTKSCQRVDASH